MDHNDPIDIQAQERAQTETGERSKAEQNREIEDLKWLMSNKRGRRFVCRQLERAGVWRLSFNTNALSMAFNEGQRNEGLRLMAQITTHCADRYTEMLKESKE